MSNKEKKQYLYNLLIQLENWRQKIRNNRIARNSVIEEIDTTISEIEEISKKKEIPDTEITSVERKLSFIKQQLMHM